MRIAAVLITLSLAACVSPQERAARNAYEAQQAEEARTQYRDNLRRQCRSAGFNEGTDAFANCVLQLHSQNQAQQMQLIQGLMLQQATQPQEPAYQRARPRVPTQTNCTRDPWGGMNCSTY